MNKQELTKKLEGLKVRSAWRRGVVTVCSMIVENFETEEIEAEEIKTVARCGATSLRAAVYGGCYLIYDKEIAETFCNKSELKKTENGEKNPNANENWLDVHYRGLIKAVMLLENFIKEEVN